MTYTYEDIKMSINEYMGCTCSSCTEFFLEERKTSIEDMCCMTEEYLEMLLEK